MISKVFDKYYPKDDFKVLDMCILSEVVEITRTLKKCMYITIMTTYALAVTHIKKCLFVFPQMAYQETPKTSQLYFFIRYQNCPRGDQQTALSTLHSPHHSSPLPFVLPVP